MSQQSTITSFFQRSEETRKRPASHHDCHKRITEGLNEFENEHVKNENISPNKEDIRKMASPNISIENEHTTIKKAKVSEENNEKNDKITSVVLTPETNPSSENQLKAKIRLLSNELSGALYVNIGHTWFEALEEEFRKPYFEALSGYLKKVHAQHS